MKKIFEILFSMMLCCSAVHECSGAEPQTCGIRKSDKFVIAHIIGGRVRPYGEFPWIVRIEENGYHKCGGSLLSTKWVVSAAHCIWLSIINKNKVSVIKMIAGDYSTKRRDAFEQVRYGIRYIAHPDFNSRTLENDIALMEADIDFVFDDFVKPACLPEHNQVAVPNTRCDIAGWGFMNKKKMSTLLRSTQVPIMPQSACYQAYRKNPRAYPITHNGLCAGYAKRKRDSCKGDSGGPLTCPNPDTNGVPWVLTGVVSWGIGCGRARNPGVYTRIQPYLRWIYLTLELPRLTNIDPCKYNGVLLDRDATGVIESPGYDGVQKGKYPQKTVCSWILNFDNYKDDRNSIAISFNDLQIRKSSRCKGESLDIYGDMEEKKLIKRYCGSTTPEPMSIPLTQTSQIKIVFRTALLPNGRGFHLMYEVV